MSTTGSCPNCKSVNVVLLDEGRLAECQSCSESWRTEELPLGPWRVGRNTNRTIYLNNQFVGHVDSEFQAKVIVASANLVNALFAEEKLSELHELEKLADDVLAGKSRGHPRDAQVFAQYIKHLVAQVKLHEG